MAELRTLKRKDSFNRNRISTNLSHITERFAHNTQTGYSSSADCYLTRNACKLNVTVYLFTGSKSNKTSPFKTYLNSTLITYPHIYRGHFLGIL